jgi:hypothetical protein
MLSGPFRLHKDFMISGRLSLPPMSTFQDHSVVSAHRSRRDMLVERSQASARKAERTHSPHELTESYCSYACLEIQEVRSVLKPFFRWVCPCRAHDGGLFDAWRVRDPEGLRCDGLRGLVKVGISARGFEVSMFCSRGCAYRCSGRLRSRLVVYCDCKSWMSLPVRVSRRWGSNRTKQCYPGRFPLHVRSVCSSVKPFGHWRTRLSCL